MSDGHEVPFEELPAEERLFRMRHSAAHVLAEAVLEMFPEAKYAIGPPVENGFYYDFDLPRPLTPDDLGALEARMRVSVERDLPIRGEQIPKAQAREIFKDQPYKLELIDGIDDALDTLTAGESTTFESTLLGGDHEGEKAQVAVTVKAVKERELPEADDDFAQMASWGCNTVRVYTAPPPDLLDAAADAGLRLIVGVHYPDWRYESVPGRRTTRRVVDAGRRALDETLSNCAGRPEVLAVSVGNEVPADIVRVHGIGAVEDGLGELAAHVRAADPEVLVTYTNFPTTEFLRVEVFEPLLQALGVVLVGCQVDGLGVVDDRVFHEDRRLGPEREGDRIARPGVHSDRIAVQSEVDHRVKGILLQIADDDLLHRRLQIGDDIAQQVVRHRAWRRDVLDLKCDRIRLEESDPDRQDPLAVLVTQDHDRHIGVRVDHQPFDRHLDLHVPTVGCSGAAVNRKCIPEPSGACAGLMLPPHAMGAAAFNRDRKRSANPIGRSRKVHHYVL